MLDRCGTPRRRALASALALLAIGLGGCRGRTSREPPIHLNPNMDEQAKVRPQAGDPLFADGRGMRPPVAGTVRRGQTRQETARLLGTDRHRNEGRVGNGTADTLPVPLDRALLERGRARFEIYCTPCHGDAGVADAIVVRRGMVAPPPFDDPRLLAMPVGQVFDVVTRGARNMPAYAAQIPVDDRWAIVAHVRALQHALTGGAAAPRAAASGPSGQGGQP